MTNQKTTKRALLSSAIALLVSVVMLIGTTFAWFTDSVTSTGNIIKSGTLDVAMEWAEGTEDPASANWKDASVGTIFNNDKWEPGYTEVRHIKIENKGTLALKYQFNIVANANVSELAKVIDVYYADPAVQIANRNALASATVLGTLSDVLGNINTSAAGELLAGDSETITIALKMREDAGNEYQDLAIGSDFAVQLVATQYTYENDSFNNLYDDQAEYPMVVSGTKYDNQPLTLSQSSEDGYKVEVVIPAVAEDGNYAMVIPPESVEVTEDTFAFDMHLELNGEKVSSIPGEEYIGKITLPHPFVTVNAVYHNGELITHDHTTGETEVSFKVSDFSPFEVKFEDHIDYSFPVEYEIVDDKCVITAGVFVEMNPANIDESLKEENSAYVVVDFVKNNKTYYAVSEKATTVVLSPESHSGKLWSVISGLQNNAHSTVYLLPGTYNEATTISVYSSMDIIGLGDTEDIKVVKLSSSSSNRHLFNCSGTKADYIQVTLRNMTLDATAKTTNSKDNAAVQSIRKTKVKCYDLDIIKGTALDAVALYVNGNNAVDGVKYPAYLYAENCSLNTTRTFGIVSTAGSYKFYHNNLTYNGTLYNTNSGSIKNLAMEYNDWDWD